MSEERQKYEQLVREKDDLVYKIETYQEAITALLTLVHKRGVSNLHLLTIEDILMTVHSAEVTCQTELLHVRLAKSVLSNTLTQTLQSAIVTSNEAV